MRQNTPIRNCLGSAQQQPYCLALMWKTLFIFLFEDTPCKLLSACGEMWPGKLFLEQPFLNSLPHSEFLMLNFYPYLMYAHAFSPFFSVLSAPMPINTATWARLMVHAARILLPTAVILRKLGCLPWCECQTLRVLSRKCRFPYFLSITMFLKFQCFKLWCLLGLIIL